MTMIEDSNTTPAIEPGKPILVEAATREEANAKVKELREQANAQGLVQASCGFVGFDPEKTDGQPFSTTLIFNEQKT
jgi:hypothetical protein